MDIGNLLLSIKKNDNFILLEGEESITGRQLVYLVDNLSVEIKEAGYDLRSPVLIRMDNTIASVVSFLSVLSCGGSVFIANPHDPLDKFYRSVLDFGIDLVIADSASISMLSGLLTDNDVEFSNYGRYDSIDLNSCRMLNNACSLESVDSSLSGPHVAIFSSGTTGEPKAIINSIENILTNASRHSSAVGISRSDVITGFLPIYYSYGLVANLLASLVSGAKFSFHPKTLGFDESWAVENKVTVLSLTPFFAQSLEVDVPSLRMLTFGGDTLSSSAANKIKAMFYGCELYSTYGLTEAGPRVATWRFDNKSIPDGVTVPIGTPLEGCSLEVESCSDDNSFGELLVGTSTRAKGYYLGKNKGFCAPFIEANKVKTGDLFFFDGKEYYFAARDKEMIVQNGEKIFPPVLESIIREVDGVVDVRVEGVVDDVRGQFARASIHSSIEVPVSKIRRHLMKKIPRSSMPSEFVFVDQVKRSSTGKKISEVKRIKINSKGKT